MKNSRIKRSARRLDGHRTYKPYGIPKTKLTSNIVNLDEFEAMRLCDLEGYSQINAAEEMQISRSTIQRLLLSGRKKIVEAILSNKVIEIKNDTNNIKLKGENKMKVEEKEVKVVAFPTSDRTTVDGHFGHTKEFVVYTVKANNIEDVTYLASPKHEPGVLPQFLATHGIDVIITGGMGRMAVDLFNGQGIDVVLGANGSIEANLNEYIGGVLESKGTSCNHVHGENHEH